LWFTERVEWPLLSPVPEAERRRILAGAQHRRFARNEIVFHEDDPGDALHLVTAGRLAVRVSQSTGEALTLNVLSPGDAFGELAILGRPRRRTASVVAWEDSETLSITGPGFSAMCREHPALERVVVTLLSERVDRLSHRLLEALYVGVELRLYRRLIELCDTYRAAASAISIPLTQDDLAELVGASRPTVNRVLARLTGAGVVRLSRGRLEVVDEAALRSLAVD
jgi:CRP-like cAMP-binding protein